MRVQANYYDLLHGLSDETIKRIAAALAAEYASANGSRAIAQEGIDLIDAGRDLHGGETREELAADWFLHDGRMLEILYVQRTIERIRRERHHGSGRVKPKAGEYSPKAFWTSLSGQTLARIVLSLLIDGRPAYDASDHGRALSDWRIALDLAAMAFSYSYGRYNPDYTFTTYDLPGLLEISGLDKVPNER